MRLLFTIVLSTLLLACDAPKPPLFDEKVSGLFHSDPKHDAAVAIANDDFRFLAIHNHDLKMPMNIDACVLDKYGYRVLSNESLEYMSYDFQIYGTISTIYANWYNYEILSKLEEQEEYPCD